MISRFGLSFCCLFSTAQRQNTLFSDVDMLSSRKVTVSVLSREQPEGVGARVRRTIGRPEVCCLGGSSCYFAEGAGGGALRINLGGNGMSCSVGCHRGQV